VLIITTPHSGMTVVSKLTDCAVFTVVAMNKVAHGPLIVNKTAQATYALAGSWHALQQLACSALRMSGDTASAHVNTMI
jgi:hypothetical protein